MSETILQLRERRNALAKEARNLVDTNPGANWKADTHGKRYDEIVGDIGNLDAEIKRKETVMQLDAERVFTDAGGREMPVNAIRVATRNYLRGGLEGMSAEDRAALNLERDNGGMRFRNTLSGDPANGTQGGDTVQTDIVSRVTEKLKLFGGMRQVSEIIQTAQGNPLSFPTSDGTSETGELVAENAAATAADPSFGTTPLNVYKFSSKVVAVPWELLQDSSVNIEDFVANRLGTRLGRIQNTKFTKGSGTNEPTGIITASSAGKTGLTGQTATVIYDDLVDLVHSVDPAYRAGGKCRFMFHDNTLAVIRKLKDSQGRPIFIPGYYDNGIAAGVADTLLGYQYQINQDIATMAANAKSIAFGDFSYYKIRDVMALTLFRFTDSVYASQGQVGFLAWMRSGGNLVDVGGAVRYYANSAT